MPSSRARLDTLECCLLLAPVVASYSLQVRDLQAAAGAPCQFKLLVDRFQQLPRVASHVRRIQLAAPLHDTA